MSSTGPFHLPNVPEIPTFQQGITAGPGAAIIEAPVTAPAAAPEPMRPPSSATQQTFAQQLTSSGQLRTQVQEQTRRLEELKGEIKQLQASAKDTKAAEESDAPTKNDLPKYYYTQREFWGGPSLSYMVYTALAIIPISGFLGMDHMYMRSPATGLFKAVMNIFTLGFWYFYDVVQAVTDQESVSEFGVSMPLYGPSGIGAGSFLKEGEAAVQNGSPGAFLLFAIGTFFLPFGLEYMFAGDFEGFAGKFIMSFLGIGLIYGIVNSLELLQHPERVICRGTQRYWPVTFFTEEVQKNTTFGNQINDNCPEIEGGISAWLSGIFGNLIKKVPVLGTLYETTAGAALEIKKQMQESAQRTVGALRTGAEVGTQAAQAVKSMQRGGGSSSGSSSDSSNGTISSTILTFTLALVFIGAAFIKGKDIMTAAANKEDGRLDDVGKFIWRKKNVFDLPPAAPKS